MTKPIITFPMFGEDFSLNPSNYIDVFGFEIYWYGIIIATGFALAAVYAMRRSPDFGLNSDNVLDMLLIATPFAIIGARLYYVVFYFELYEDNLLGIFSIRDGGLAIYGGIIFAAIGLIVASRIYKFSAPAMMDVGALGLLIGQCIGRWGNFMNREAFGAETDIFCRMGLTDIGTGITSYVHPTFFYESFWNFIGFLLLHTYTKKCERKFDGQIFLMYIAWYGFGRMFTEGLRTDSLYLFGTIRVSQLLGLLSCLVALGIIAIILKRGTDPEKLWKNRK